MYTITSRLDLLPSWPSFSVVPRFPRPARRSLPTSYYFLALAIGPGHVHPRGHGHGHVQQLVQLPS